MKDWEARNLAVGRHAFSAAALAADGSMAGLSGLSVDVTRARTVGSVRHHPGRAAGTVVTGWGSPSEAAVTDLALEHFPGLV